MNLIISIKVRNIVYLVFFLLLVKISSVCGEERELSFNPIIKNKISRYLEENEQAFSHIKLGIYISEVNSEREIFSLNSDNKLIPASLFKLILSYAALKELGTSFLYPTEIYIDKPNFTLKPDLKYNDFEKSAISYSGGNIYLRGYGDPSLVEERLWKITSDLKKTGLVEVDNVIIDDSLFVEPIGPTGEESYRAGLSATCYNFNAYEIKVSPSIATKKPFISLSDGVPYKIVNNAITNQSSKNTLEVSQSPKVEGLFKTRKVKTEPIEKEKVTTYKEFPEVLVTGIIGDRSEPKSFYLPIVDTPIYLGLAFKSFLGKAGIAVRGIVKNDVVDKKAVLIKTDYSRFIFQILQDMNKYSNNIMANQIFYSLGQDNDGKFNLRKAKKVVLTQLGKIGLSENSIEIEEMSGLSVKDKITARSLTRLLNNIKKDFEIFPYFISSLSKFKEIGTLRNRRLLEDEDKKNSYLYDKLLKREATIWAKTGTLDYVSGIAGYAEMEDGHLASFVIISNGNKSKEESVKIENQILRILIGAE